MYRHTLYLQWMTFFELLLVRNKTRSIFLQGVESLLSQPACAKMSQQSSKRYIRRSTTIVVWISWLFFTNWQCAHFKLVSMFFLQRSPFVKQWMISCSNVHAICSQFKHQQRRRCLEIGRWMISNKKKISSNNEYFSYNFTYSTRRWVGAH